MSPDDLQELVLAEGALGEIIERREFRWSTERTYCRLARNMLVFGRREKGSDGAPRYPHLTIAWATASGELDIHLKYEARQGDDRYESLLRRPVLELAEAFVERFEECSLALALDFEAKGRFFRPGWLWKQGYAVMWISPEDLLGYVNEWLPPKRRKKYDFAGRPFINHARMLEVADRHLYHPEILHVLRDHPVLWAGDRPPQVYAHHRFQRRGRRRRPDLVLSPRLTPTGRLRWMGHRRGDMDLMVARFTHQVASPALRAAMPILDRVYDAMRLDELGVEKPSECLAEFTVAGILGQMGQARGRGW